MFLKFKQAYVGIAAGQQVDVADAGQAKALVEQGIAEAVQGDPLGSLIEKQVGGMIENLTKGLDTAINDAIKGIAAAQSKSRKNSVPAIFGVNGDGDPKKNFGDFCLCIATKNFKR